MVDPGSFAGKERKVRCVACGHEWIEQPKQTPANENGAKPPFLNRLLRWPLFAIFFAGIVASFFLLRCHLQKELPGLLPIYNAIGMCTQKNTSILIENVACTTTQQNNQNHVIVSGTLISTEDTTTPELKAQLFDEQAEIDEKGICTKNCHPITWQFKMAATKLEKGTAIRFESKSPQPVLEDVARCFVGVAK